MGVDNERSSLVPFEDLNDANEEIGRLKNQLYFTNIKWRDAVEKGELVKRSLMGELKATQAKLASVEEGRQVAVLERDMLQRRLDAALAAQHACATCNCDLPDDSGKAGD
jgi:hypothetical protein